MNMLIEQIWYHVENPILSSTNMFGRNAKKNTGRGGDKIGPLSRTLPLIWKRNLPYIIVYHFSPPTFVHKSWIYVYMIWHIYVLTVPDFTRGYFGCVYQMCWVFLSSLIISIWIIILWNMDLLHRKWKWMGPL